MKVSGNAIAAAIILEGILRYWRPPRRAITLDTRLRADARTPHDWRWRDIFAIDNHELMISTLAKPRFSRVVMPAISLVPLRYCSRQNYLEFQSDFDIFFTPPRAVG